MSSLGFRYPWKIILNIKWLTHRISTLLCIDCKCSQLALLSIRYDTLYMFSHWLQTYFIPCSLHPKLVDLITKSSLGFPFWINSHFTDRESGSSRSTKLFLYPVQVRTFVLVMEIQVTYFLFFRGYTRYFVSVFGERSHCLACYKRASNMCFLPLEKLLIKTKGLNRMLPGFHVK